MRNIIIHIPHDGDVFPEELMSSVCVPEKTFMRYHEEMRDRKVSSFIPDSCSRPISTITFDISRLLCDVERFIGPEEVMEQYGMGFCYERAYDGTIIKNVSPQIKEETLRYYASHHARLDELVKECPYSLLIDLHSFSETILPAGRKTQVPVPDICIGTDDTYTPRVFADETEKIFRKEGFSVARNYPYSGTMVPDSVLNREVECDLISIMIEINKAVYLDVLGNVDKAACFRICNAIEDIINASDFV